VSKLAVKDIIVDPAIQIRRSNHELTIRRYEESFDQLPPVVVFRTKEGLLLADGFHRVAAAQRLGRREIDAEIRTGSRENALEYAVVANTKNADPLTPEERDEGIRRLHQLHPRWPNQKIANAMSVSENTVRYVFNADRVRKAVLVGKHSAQAESLKSSHFTEIAAAPQAAWDPLVGAASKRGWSRDVTRLAVQNLKDDRLSSEHKAKLLSGRADPVVRTADGDLAVPATVMSRQIRDMAANDAVLALERALEHLAKLRLFSVRAIVRTAGNDRLERLQKELPKDIEFMEELLNAVKKERRPHLVS
jgi:ParB-like chromosome segregation protein Spo0J